MYLHILTIIGLLSIIIKQLLKLKIVNKLKYILYYIYHRSKKKTFQMFNLI